MCLQAEQGDTGEHDVQDNDREGGKPHAAVRIHGTAAGQSGGGDTPAGERTDNKDLHRRGAEGAQGTDALHHRPGAIPRGTLRSHGQRKERRGKAGNGTAERGEHGDAPRQGRGAGLRPERGPQRAQSGRGGAGTGTGAGGERTQQPVVHRGEESCRRRGRNDCLPRGSARVGQHQRTARHRVRRQPHVCLLLADRESGDGTH